MVPSDHDAAAEMYVYITSSVTIAIQERGLFSEVVNGPGQGLGIFRRHPIGHNPPYEQDRRNLAYVEFLIYPNLPWAEMGKKIIHHLVIQRETRKRL